MADLRIGKMVYGGAGMAHADGETYFVPFTLPEEHVRAEAEGRSRGHVEARLLEVLDPSPQRVAPRCRHFGVCGGCQYQHTGEATQLAIKQSILRETMERGGVTPPSQIETHSSEPWGYRNRIQLRLARVNNAWSVGYSERGSHRFMPAQECPIATPALWAVAQTLETALNRDAAWASAPLFEAELACDENGEQVQLSLGLDVAMSAMERETPALFRSLCSTLQTAAPALEGAGIWVWANESTQKHRNAIEIVHWGTEALLYSVGRLQYTVARGGFFQVNRFLTQRLVDLVTNNRRGDTAWDLYAGAGLFAQSLVGSFRSVIAVESGERSAAALAAMMVHYGRPHAAIRQDTLAFLRENARASSKPDLIVMDPPRAGLGIDVCNAIASIAAPELVYVSCDPTTLTRDLRSLLESGYRLAELHLVDLFPQTFHMESVAVLRR